MLELDRIIREKRNSLKTDRMNMSFGELMSIYEEGDLYITPEYQRIFRWTAFQQTRFIESVLLGIPVPSIFVAEDGDGKWEVVDGLQRLSTIFSFFGLLETVPEKNHSTLTEGEMIKELNGCKLKDLSLKSRLAIKRSVCRVEIVCWNSDEDIRYELFNRLHTGSSSVSAQEIRNCIFRSFKVDLNQALHDIAIHPEYIGLINPTGKEQEELLLEELALRFFAFKHSEGYFTTTVAQYLTAFMRSVSKGDIEFNLEQEKAEFINFVNFLYEQFDKNIFRPNHNFSTHIFDSLAFSMPKVFGTVKGNEKKVESAINALLTDEAYQSIDTSTFSDTHIGARMDRAIEVFTRYA